MPTVEINENECVYMRDGIVCRATIVAHDVLYRPPFSVAPPRATLTVEVSNMQAPRRTTELEYQRQRVEEVQRLVASGLVRADALDANRNGDIFAPSVRTAAQNTTTALPAEWGISNTPRQQANSFEGAWAVSSPSALPAAIEADRPESAEVSLQPDQNISAAVNEMLAEANEDALAALRDALPQPEANNELLGAAAGFSAFRVGALGRAWLVSHFISTFVPLTTETTSLNVIEVCTENVRQALEAAANLYPQMSERWLRVMGYPRREDFPPVETAAATCHDTIYFARNTWTLYWVRPADNFWHAASAYVPFAPLSLPRSDAQPPTVDGSDSAPFTLPAGTTIPTRAVQGDPVVVSMPQVRPARTWRIQHAGNFDNTGGVAGLAFNRQVDAVMALVPDAELPDNFRGVVTFGDRDSFPARETLPDNAACWFYFSRSEGDLYRVTPFRSGFQYTRIASSVAPPTAAIVTSSGGLQMVNSWGHSGSWGTRPAQFDHMVLPPPIPLRPAPPPPPRPVHTPIPVSGDRPRRLMLND